METPFLDAFLSSLPSYRERITEICAQSELNSVFLNDMLSFAAGGEMPLSASPETRQEWAQSQTSAFKSLLSTTGKRTRDDDTQSSKRQKIENDTPRFTIHSISVARKKVDVTVHESSITFTNPTTHAIEATVPLSILRRAFLLPTRGKPKEHWTVVLLSTDTSQKGKPPPPNVQVIFGFDALASIAMKTTTHSDNTTQVVAKASPTLPTLRTFFSYIPSIPLLEPAQDGVFSSAVVSGSPSVEAFRAAKSGTLWFLRAGLLWGESKPCEFWPLSDLADGDDGVRLLSATGRSCSVRVGRKDHTEEPDENGERTMEETEFAMIEGKEQAPIASWVASHKHLFGKEPGGDVDDMVLDSDVSDDDFEADSTSDGGSPSSSSGEEDSDEDGEDEESAEESEEEEELDPKKHPLLRAQLPMRMSENVMNMAVGMVTEELMQGAGEDADEEDELLDD